MNFDIEKPGLIILNQFKTLEKENTINHYFYISSEGLDYYFNNLSVLNKLNINQSLLLDLIKDNYKQQFEFALDKVDLGYFHCWTTLQIQIYHDGRRSHYSNVSRFLNHHKLHHTFDEKFFTYKIEQHPEIINQKDMYFLINDLISKDLSHIFKKENVITCYLNDDDFSIWKNYENKIEFLEKIRMRNNLQKNLCEKNLQKNNKI